MIHAYGSLSHYAAHLAPILRALPDRIRGRMWTPREGLPWGTELPPMVEHDPTAWFLVASLADMQRLHGHPLIYVEHGAGQTYVGHEQHGSYSGGDHRAFDVRLYLSPNETVADRWRANGSPAIAVGCPRLDQHAGVAIARDSRVADPDHRPVVAFTWHWLCELVTETFTAWPAYERDHMDAVLTLRDAGCQVIGHAHPRFQRVMAEWYTRNGIPFLRDLDDVLARADVLAADNTSALPEAAAVGMPVVWINAPQWRRNVQHGGRFWEWPTGQVQVDHSPDLAAAVLDALVDPPDVRAMREAMVARIYDRPVGTATPAAVAAVIETWDRWHA